MAIDFSNYVVPFLQDFTITLRPTCKVFVVGSRYTRPDALKAARCQIPKTFTFLQKKKQINKKIGAQLGCAPNPTTK